MGVIEVWRRPERDVIARWLVLAAGNGVAHDLGHDVALPGPGGGRGAHVLRAPAGCEPGVIL